MEEVCVKMEKCPIFNEGTLLNEKFAEMHTSATRTGTAQRIHHCR